MIIPDINVLVYAFRPEEANHPDYAVWLHGVTQASEDVGLIDSVLTGFLRIVTNPRIFAQPAPLSNALSFANALRTSKPAKSIHATRSAWDQFAAFAANDQGLRGNLVPDAWLAAIAVSAGARVATADSGFARFMGLEWFDPAR